MPPRTSSTCVEPPIADWRKSKQLSGSRAIDCCPEKLQASFPLQCEEGG
jgi:hypothetical protein